MLFSHKIFITLEEEQYKIANCISILDEMIEVDEVAIEKLKEHKAGLMQKLFVKAV